MQVLELIPNALPPGKIPPYPVCSHPNFAAEVKKIQSLIQCVMEQSRIGSLIGDFSGEMDASRHLKNFSTGCPAKDLSLISLVDQG